MKLNPFEAIHMRKEKRINEQVSMYADKIGSEIHLAIRKRDEVGPFSKDAGKRPGGIHADEYVNRVQKNVIAGLGRVGLGDEVEYDFEASREASTEYVDLGPGNQGILQDKEKITIVFNRRAGMIEPLAEPETALDRSVDAGVLG